MMESLSMFGVTNLRYGEVRRGLIAEEETMATRKAAVPRTKSSRAKEVVKTRTEVRVANRAKVGVEEESTSTELGMSQTDAALNAIRSRIIDLTIPPGSRIDEPLLLNNFLLGRTPAREAINRLVAEGFVNIMPNRGGTFVRKLDFEEIGEILVAHQLAENILGQLLRFEATLADDLSAIQERYRKEVRDRRYLNITASNEQFHMRMNRSVGNSFFYEFAQSTHRHVRRLLVHLYQLEAAAEPGQQDEQFKRNLAEHDRIIEIVRKKDRAALVKLLPEHARTTQDRFVHILAGKTVDPFPISLQPLEAQS
jgi:DNA-binding GntR family transcriptional regulator